MNNLLRKAVLKIYGEYISEYYSKDLYTVCTSSAFTSKFYSTKNAMDMYDFFDDCKKSDRKLPISRNTGRGFEDLFLNKDITIGIYSASFEENELQSSRISEIIHTGINVNYKNPYIKKEYVTPDLNGNIYFPEDMIEAMDIIRSDCRNSGIVFILTFPKTLVDEDGDYNDNSISELFKLDKDAVYLRPEYIDSYFVYKKGIINRIRKDDLKKVLIKK